jgi:hypothetical protein
LQINQANTPSRLFSKAVPARHYANAKKAKYVQHTGGTHAPHFICRTVRPQ